MPLPIIGAILGALFIKKMDEAGEQEKQGKHSLLGKVNNTMDREARNFITKSKFQLGEALDKYNEVYIVVCPRCGADNRVIQNRGNTIPICGRCKAELGG